MTRRRISNTTPRELTAKERSALSDVVLERDSDFRVKTGSVDFVGDYPPDPGVMVVSEHDGKMYYADINGWNEMSVPIPTYRYNGIDNYHFNGVDDFLIGNNSGSIRGRFYCGAAAGGITQIFASADEAANDSYISIISNAAGYIVFQFKNVDVARTFMRTTVPLLEGWYIFELVFDGIGYSLYINGIKQELLVLIGADDPLWFADVPTRDNISIGAIVQTDIDYYFNAVQWIQIDDGVNGDWHYDAATNSFIDRSANGLDLAPVGTWP